MCITVNKANLAKTKIMSLPLESGNHFIAYSNKVKNLSGKPNAMILPIPGITNQSLFHDTTKYKDFMDEITKKCRLQEDYFGIQSKGMSRGLLSASSFDQFVLGQYTIGLAKGFEGIKEFLNTLTNNKRPEVSKELADFFQEKYAGWSFAICVFDSDKTIDAQPIAFEYKPFGNGLIYFPTMDSHDGGAPDLKGFVSTDHTFIYEHTGNKDPKDRYYQEFVTLDADVPSFLQNRSFRAETSHDNFVRNGDTYLKMEDLKNSDFKTEPQFKRISPVPHIPIEKHFIQRKF